MATTEIRFRIQRLTSLWGGTIPLMNAPMPGVTTPEMVAAVSCASGLGVLAADFMSAEELSREIEAVRKLTDKPFAVNLRARDKEGKSQFFDTEVERQTARRFAHAMSDLAVDLGLPADYPPAQLPDFDEQLECILSQDVGFVTVSFGGLREIYADKLKDAGIVTIGAATTLREAKVMRSAGVDAVIVQGAEAGGPRLNFEAADEHSLVGLMNLIGPAARATQLPVVASGGLMTGAQFAAALVAGASGAMLGTALLKSTESAAHPAHQAALEFASDNATVLTRLYDGRWARVLENGLIEAVQDAGLTLAGYPNQWRVAHPLSEAARRNDRDDLMPLYAGQGAELAYRAPCATILENFVQGAKDALGEEVFG